MMYFAIVIYLLIMCGTYFKRALAQISNTIIPFFFAGSKYIY